MQLRFFVNEFQGFLNLAENHWDHYIFSKKFGGKLKNP